MGRSKSIKVGATLSNQSGSPKMSPALPAAAPRIETTSNSWSLPPAVTDNPRTEDFTAEMEDMKMQMNRLETVVEQIIEGQRSMQALIQESSFSKPRYILAEKSSSKQNSRQ